MSKIYQDIPTWNNGTWELTSFNSRQEFADDVKSIFKEPGLYEFDETSFLFNFKLNITIINAIQLSK